MMADVDGKTLWRGDRVQIAPVSENAPSLMGTVAGTCSGDVKVKVKGETVKAYSPNSLIKISK